MNLSMKMKNAKIFVGTMFIYRPIYPPLPHYNEESHDLNKEYCFNLQKQSMFIMK